MKPHDTQHVLVGVAQDAPLLKHQVPSRKPQQYIPAPYSLHIPGMSKLPLIDHQTRQREKAHFKYSNLVKRKPITVMCHVEKDKSNMSLAKLNSTVLHPNYIGED